MTRDYYRRQAQVCLRLAQTCADTALAERLRLMAQDFLSKAEELGEDNDGIPPQMMKRGGSPDGEMDRD